MRQTTSFSTILSLGALFGVSLANLAGAQADDLLREQAPGTERHGPIASKPVIEIAILLDTSNSMDGLIDQARARLWAIVNTVATAHRDGALPDLRVALVEYGNDGLAPAEGHIRLVVPLCDDLDRISAELFALRTNGGQEYCGHAIQAAIARLQWTEGAAYRAIFIAGNEPFTQGSVDFRKAVAAAAARGVAVNTIHCGAPDEGRRGMWEEAARLGGGRAMNIDQNAETVAIPTPYDERLAALGVAINDTYIGYGRLAEGRREMQKAQDDRAASAAPGAAAERAIAKGGSAYRNASWDLVDAIALGKLSLEAIPESDLPEEMRKMTPDERKAHVAKKTAERRAIQEEIAKLTVEREKFVAAERARIAGRTADTFDSAVREVVTAQLAAKGFALESTGK